MCGMSKDIRRFILSPRNELLISTVTAWEITIKAKAGKFQLDRPPAAYVLYYIGSLSLIPLPISFEHVFGVSDLPLYHGDPFDRLLIAQARLENIPLVTGDSAIERYDVKTIW